MICCRIRTYALRHRQASRLARVRERCGLGFIFFYRAGVAGLGCGEACCGCFCYGVGYARRKARRGYFTAVLQGERRYTVCEGHSAVGAAYARIAQRYGETEVCGLIRCQVA